MTRPEQRQFLNELLDNVRVTMNAKLDRIPENWDGREIRQWVADHCKENVAYLLLSPARKRDYKNTLIVNNL